MADPISVTDTLSLADDEITITYIRSSGPGGQNVNKVATAAQLRFNLMASRSLPYAVKHRAAKLAGSRLTTDGEIVLTASSHRTQALNRDDAINRLVDLLRRAAVPPKRRVPTKPTRASKTRRLDAKSKRSTTKRLRKTRIDTD